MEVSPGEALEATQDVVVETARESRGASPFLRRDRSELAAVMQ